MPDSTPSTVNGYDLELFNAPVLSARDGGNFRISNPQQPFSTGGYLTFNGTDEYGTVDGLLDTPPTAGCVSLWLRLDAEVASGDTVFSKASAYSGANITEGCSLAFADSGKTMAFAVTSGGTTSTAQLELGGVWGGNGGGHTAWHHIVCAWGTKVRLYIDGEEIGQATHTGAWTAGSSAPFGVAAKYLGSASGFANVSIDEIEIRNVEPTLVDIQTWANRGGLPQPFERERWVRNASNPLLAPTVSEEDNAVFEPQITRVGANNYVGVYTGGADEARLFGMTSTDGKALTKTGIVMGHGVGGHAGDACRPFLLNDNGTLYLYFTDEITTTGGSIHYATTDDGGETWEEQGVVLEPDDVRTGFANASVVKLNSTYHWLIEHVRAGAGQAYFVSHYTSTSPTGPLTLTESELANVTLQQGVGSTSSRLVKIGSNFHLFMHAGRYSNLPTAIYHAVSEDCLRWDIRGGGYPVLPIQDFSVLSRQDQSADCCVYEIPESGEVGMLYDIDDNHGGGYVARICGATFEGALTDLA